MDQEIGWWLEVVFGGWRHRSGPRYQRLAAALLDAINQRVVASGVRLPAERSLAAALGVSRGTVVACFQNLVALGVLRRFQGSGTFVVGRPSWVDIPVTNSVATLLLRQMAEGDETIDLSVASPGDLRHLPSVNVHDAWASLDGHGLEPTGLWDLRVEVARHLSEHQQLPTQPEQIIITAGAHEALSLLSQVLAAPSGRLVTSCPTYLGLASAFSNTDRRLTVVRADADGVDVNDLQRASRNSATVVYLMSTGHNPTGAVMSLSRRQSVAAIADVGRAIVIEDLSLADLVLDDAVAPRPLAAMSDRVIAVGSASKLLWGGLRVGWLRADESLRRAVVEQKVKNNLATSAIDQALTTQLLANIDAEWLTTHRRALRQRRDHMTDLLSSFMPSWSVQQPSAGLSLWIDVPVESTDAFVHVAARHGVAIAAGRSACLDGEHFRYVRVSFAAPLDTLWLAAERLRAAWEAYARDLAASPARLRSH